MLRKAGIKDLILVTGYYEEKIKHRIGNQVHYMHYPKFTLTNNLYTLHYCRSLLDQATIILFSVTTFLDYLLVV